MSVHVRNAIGSETFRFWAHKQAWEVSGQQKVMGRQQWAQDVGSDCHNQTFHEAVFGEMVGGGLSFCAGVWGQDS